MANSVRPEFVAHMNAELEAHASLGDFSQFRLKDDNDALFWLHEHEVKLAMALFSHDANGARDVNAVRNHCADVANIAMKIEEQFGPQSLGQVTEPLPGITP